MSNAINKLKELYLLSNIALCNRDLNVPDYQTKSVNGLLKCIKDYIDLKGFELNYEKSLRFPYGVIKIDDDLIRARFKDKYLYILIKNQDKNQDDYKIKLENEVKECGAYFFSAAVINSKSFDDFVSWFENEIIGKEV